MATKKLSAALLALTAPEFGAEVEMPAISLNGTTVTATAAELNFVDGVTSNVQTQLNAKAATVHTQSGATITTDNSIIPTRYPEFNTTARGAVPMCNTSTGSQVLADNGWTNKNNVYSAYQTLTEGTPVTWSVLSGYNATITLTGNRILSITDAANGMSGCLIVKQGTTGGHTLTLPSGSKLLGATSLTLTSATGSVDILTFSYDGTNYYWSQGANYLTVT